jgi:hypothetical protein
MARGGKATPLAMKSARRRAEAVQTERFAVQGRENIFLPQRCGGGVTRSQVPIMICVSSFHLRQSFHYAHHGAPPRP